MEGMKMSSANELDVELNHRQTAWAREQLGVPEAAGQSEIRQAFLKHIANEEFVPGDSIVEAFELLQPDSAPIATNEYSRFERLQADEQVEAFAGRFFSLPPNKRLEEWNKLHEACTTAPRAVAALNRLERSLSLDIERLRLQGEMKELANLLCEQAVLPPIKRADRRVEIIERCTSDPQPWERAAQRMKSRYRDVAELDWTLVEHLSNWSRSRKVMRKPPIVYAGPRAPANRPSWNVDFNLAKHWWLVGVVILIVANVVRVAIEPAINPSSGYMPSYRPPPPIPDSVLQDENLRRIFQELQSKRDNQSPSPRLPTVSEDRPSLPVVQDPQTQASDLWERIEAQSHAPQSTSTKQSPTLGRPPNRPVAPNNFGSPTSRTVPFPQPPSGGRLL
jgi:hypothetical protein